jgi:hypothetical protein
MLDRLKDLWQRPDREERRAARAARREERNVHKRERSAAELDAEARHYTNTHHGNVGGGSIGGG